MLTEFKKQEKLTPEVYYKKKKLELLSTLFLHKTSLLKTSSVDKEFERLLNTNEFKKFSLKNKKLSSLLNSEKDLLLKCHSL